MSQKWPWVRLSELATPVNRLIPVELGKPYRTIGVKWWGEGAYERQTIDGSQTAAKMLAIVRKDDLIINKIWVRHGSTAIATQNVDGCAASNEFPTFELDGDKVSPRWLHWLTKTRHFWSQCDALSMGTSGKNRIKPERFLTIEIPLPPVVEQRRIVAKIHALVAKIEEAKTIRTVLVEHERRAFRDAIFKSAFHGERVSQSSNGASAVELVTKLRSLKEQLIAEKKVRPNKTCGPILDSEKPHPVPANWEWVRLDDLCSVITDGTHITPTYIEEGRPFLSAQNVKPYRFMPQNHRKVPEDLYRSCAARAKPEKGDILMTRVGAMIGEAAIIDQELDFAYYVSLCLLKPFKEHFSVSYLTHWLNSPYGNASSRSKTLGRGHSQGNLNLNLIRQFVIPFPPLEEQHRIATYLDEVQSRAEATKRLQEETAEELNGMLPAILDRAFRGEL